jgi:hypothetical protein
MIINLHRPYENAVQNGCVWNLLPAWSPSVTRGQFPANRMNFVLKSTLEAFQEKAATFM